jgi:O-antigen biosynthesis protein
MGRVGICAFVKDEAIDLLEWIAYHLLVGFDHIVLFDNGSQDGGPQLIQNSLFASCVTIIDWSEKHGLFGQLSAYSHFCKHLAKSFEWVAFIDIDEFIVPLNDNSIKSALPQYDGFSGILVQWLSFGPSGHDKRPPGLVIENYCSRLPEAHGRCRWVKSLLRTGDIKGVGDGPHVFHVTGRLCNTRRETVPPFAQFPQSFHDVLVINHYFTKSREDWSAKLRRGFGMPGWGSHDYTLFEEHSKFAIVRDVRIQRFVPLVKQTIASATLD